MVRVLAQGSRPAPAAPGPAASRHRDQNKAANGTKPAYKVVMEEKLKPKRKLLTSVRMCPKMIPRVLIVAVVLTTRTSSWIYLCRSWRSTINCAVQGTC